jgi:sodium-coupled neutral amino acid transporter 11
MCAFGIIMGNTSKKSSPILHLTFCQGDTIPHVIRSVFPHLKSTPVLSVFGNRQFVIALCTICVSFPLSLYRDIHKLSRASGLALVGMIVIVSSVLIRAPQSPEEFKGDPEQRFTVIQPGLFQAIGVISFAFVCHHNSLLIYGSMNTPTIDRFTLVTHVSTLFSLISCCILAISAFWVFTNKTQGNILNNFPAVRNPTLAKVYTES